MRGPKKRGGGEGLPLPVFIVLAMVVIGGGLYGVLKLLQPPPPLPYVTLTFFDSRAEIRRRGEAEWQPLESGAHLTEGDSIRTGGGLRTTLSLDNNSTIRIGSHSIVEVTHYKAAEGRMSLDLTLETGRVWVDRGNNATVHVSTEVGTVEVSGRHVEVLANSRQIVARAWKGTAVFTPRQGPPVTVSESTEVAVPTRGALVSRAIDPADIDAFARWNRSAQTAQIVVGRIKPQDVEQARPTLAMASPSDTRTAIAAPPAARPAVPRAAAPLPATAPAVVPKPTASATPAPTSVATRTDPLAPRAASVASTYDPPGHLTHRGLPDLRTRVNKELPSVDPYSPDSVSHAYSLMAQQLTQHFNMRLTRPIKLTLVSPSDFATLRTFSHGGGRSFTTEWLKVNSSSDRHDAYVISGLTATMIWEACSQAFAAAWYEENARGGSAKQREKAGFMMWIDYKGFEIMGATSQAAIYLDPRAFPAAGTESMRIGGQVIMSDEEILGLEQMLTLEKQFGEYGVFYYVTHGSPPD